MVIPDKVDTDRQPDWRKSQIDHLTSRSIRSFVIRNGRTTPAQHDAISRLMPHVGIGYDCATVSLDSLFGRAAPVYMEIGFGNGDVLLNLAEAHPEANVLGVEVHSPGLGHALIGMEKRGLTNLRFIQHDALEVLQHMIGSSTLERLLLLFPDPWHKKRHHKRRLVQQEFRDAVARTLKPDGILHLATDWQDYAAWMMDELEPDPRFINVAGPSGLSTRPSWRPVTRFEKRGEKLGHDVSDLLYRRHDQN